MSNSEPLVSIVMASYNAELYIIDTITSIFNQTYANWELLIADDASTDMTVNKIEQLMEQDTRIRLFKSLKNMGAGASRNIGIKEARGKYLTFLDADDQWNANYLEKQIAFIRKKNAAFIFASYERKNSTLDQSLGIFIVPEQVAYNDILCSSPISCLTAFIDIEVLGKKYMSKLKKRQDICMFLEYLKSVKYAYGNTEVLATYRICSNSLSRNKLSCAKYQWLLYRQYVHLGRWRSMRYLFCWMFKGVLKYRSSWSRQVQEKILNLKGLRIYGK